MVPVGCLRVVFWNAVPEIVGDAEFELRVSESLLSGLCEPVERLRAILVYPVAVIVGDAEFVLGAGFSLLGGLCPPVDGLLEVLGDAMPECVERSEFELRQWVSLLGLLLDLFNDLHLGVVLGDYMSLLISDPSKRDDDQCGEECDDGQSYLHGIVS